MHQANTTSTNTDHSDRINEAFIHKSQVELNAMHFWGKFQWYPGGGYVANLGENRNDASQIVATLADSNWIDAYTRVIFVEFNVWNANSNLFNMFMLSLELLPSGGVNHWVTINSINLYRYSGSGGLVNLLAELLLTVFVVVVTVSYLVGFARGKKRCSDFWVVIMLVSLALFYTGLGFLCVAVGSHLAELWRKWWTIKVSDIYTVNIVINAPS